MTATYSVSEYGAMVADQVRRDAYCRAMAQVLQPGDVVLEIGAGVGYFTLVACKLGASKVYAVEPSPAIHLAAEFARANGFADRVEIFQDLSTRIQLPQLADVCVSDLRGCLPLFQRHLPSIFDARKRLLRPGAAMIPLKDSIHVAVVESPKNYAALVDVWDSDPNGFDLSTARRLAVNQKSKRPITESELLTQSACWATLDYSTLNQPNAFGEVSLTALRKGTAQGLAVWFASDIAKGVTISNAPDSPDLVYGRMFFPFEHPVPIHAGDVVEVMLRADLVGDDYVWGWNTRFLSGSQPETVLASFRQSTFFGDMVSPHSMQKLAITYKPNLSAEAEVDRFILNLMDGTRTIEQVARQTFEQFPDRFDSLNSALSQATRLSLQYGR